MQKDILTKLMEAQKLLSEVYGYACKNNFELLANQLSVADGCIMDAIFDVEQTEEYDAFGVNLQNSFNTEVK